MRVDASDVDARWLEVALGDTNTLLEDHAHCERKAAGTALALVARYPQIPRLVSAMTALAVEELGHFAEVHAVLVARGRTLGADPGDPYAKALVSEVRGTEGERLRDRLLVSALIEARSCRRLVLLGEHHPDAGLAEMFRRFARAEGAHGNLFVALAREVVAPLDVAAAAGVDARLDALRAVEQRLIDSSPVRCAMH